MDNKPSALGVYCYAGGFTQGIRSSFEVHAHLEDAKPYAQKTARANLHWPESPELGGALDIIPEIPLFDHAWGGHKLAQQHLLDTSVETFGRWRQDYTLIYGNPPCAAWSQAGRRGDHWRSDPRVDCTRKLLKLLELHRPEMWVWETIRSTWTKGNEFIRTAADEINAQGYSCSVILHDARWLGCPQVRKRVFVVAHKVALQVGRPNADARKLAWDGAAAIDSLNDKGEPYTGSEVDLYTHLWHAAADGEKLNHAFDRVHGGERKGVGLPAEKGRPGFLLRRLPSTGPAYTVIAPVMHHREPRWLTLKELQHLSGFPSEWVWEAADKAAVSELARGVCPTVGAWLGRQLRRSLDTNKPTETGRFLVDLLTENTHVTRF